MAVKEERCKSFEENVAGKTFGVIGADRSEGGMEEAILVLWRFH